MMGTMSPQPDRIIARYQRELAESQDKVVRYAALADELADQLDEAQAEVRRLKAELGQPDAQAEAAK